MKRPSYATVSYSLLALAIFGFIIEGLRPHIPKPNPNRLQFEASEFLEQGSRSEVDWRPLESSAFAEARRTGRPILLLIGAPWSKLARDAEDQIFDDREVVSFLNRYMVCVRIDAETEPRWLTAFLPLRRASLPMPTGFQVWFLTPEGQLFDNAGEIGTKLPIDPDAFGDVLLRARERLRGIRANAPNAPVPGAEQADDVRALAQTSFPRRYDLTQFESDVSAELRSASGGSTRFGRVIPSAGALQFLLQSGRLDDFRKMADALIRSPMVDWLDGGFYRSYYTSIPRSLEFDKLALANAELMSVLAKGAAVLNEPAYREIAEACFDELVRDFVQNGIVIGCRIGDEGDQGRSARNSFSPKRLRELLTPEEREIAREKMGLRVETNRFMSVRLSNPKYAHDDSTGVPAVLEKLRVSRSGEPQYAGRRQIDIHGFVAARMLECARLWNDNQRLLQSDELFGRLEWFLAGDDVRHTLEEGIPDEPCIADYLAFSDAALQYYLTFGRPTALNQGLRVLKRARFLFERETPGVWLSALRSKEALGPRDVDVPEILDLIRESCTAQAIRLCSAYGRLFKDAELLQAAQSAVGQFSASSGALGIEGAGLFCAVGRVADDVFAIVAGPGSVARANTLYRRFPNRLIAPSLASLTGNLPATSEISVISRGLAKKFSTVAEASRALSSQIQFSP